MMVCKMKTKILICGLSCRICLFDELPLMMDHDFTAIEFISLE